MNEANLYFFRGITFAKDYLVKYLKYVFLAEEKGQLNFIDGTKKMEFSSRPMIMKYLSWTGRELPAILIGSASGDYQFMSIAKDIVDAPTEGESGDVREVGGEISLNVDLTIIATSIPERDKLVDIVGIFLSHPDAKDYFYQHDLLLPGGPSVRAESTIELPNIDHPVYSTSMNIRVIGNWRAKESEDLKLLKIITSISNM